jgi:hypothetical protein
MASGGSASGKTEAADGGREHFITARNESGQFQAFGKEKETEYGGPVAANPFAAPGRSTQQSGQSGQGGQGGQGDMHNMLRHIEQLEGKLSAKEKQLLEAQHRVEKFSARTREGMQSALDSLMKKWMDACETKDEKCKEQFKSGMEKLVQNSAEENGVWQMMVAASALHQRQEHDLDKLRTENSEMRSKIDGQYATKGSRTAEDVLGKRKAESQPDEVEPGYDLWSDFAKDCAGF